MQHQLWYIFSLSYSYFWQSPSRNLLAYVNPYAETTLFCQKKKGEMHRRYWHYFTGLLREIYATRQHNVATLPECYISGHGVRYGAGAIGMTYLHCSFHTELKTTMWDFLLVCFYFLNFHSTLSKQTDYTNSFILLIFTFWYFFLILSLEVKNIFSVTCLGK